MRACATCGLDISGVRGRGTRCAGCYAPQAWLLYFRRTATRLPAPAGSAAGGSCWVPEAEPGVSDKGGGYLQLRTLWPGEERPVTTMAHRATLAAAMHGGERLVSEWDGAALTVHHLCRRPGCVRPDHLEALAGHHNNAEKGARLSMGRAAKALVGELEAELVHERDRARSLLKELGVVRQERDDLQGYVDQLEGQVETQAGSIRELSADVELMRAGKGLRSWTRVDL